MYDDVHFIDRLGTGKRLMSPDMKGRRMFFTISLWLGFRHHVIIHFTHLYRGIESPLCNGST